MGCELISGSGATAVFIMEAAHSTGLRFSNVYSIGNASQTGAEDILEYMDINFNPETSPKIKLLYLENIKNPFKFLRHSTSLINKGCRIAAIKSGYSEAGSRAASSHTGAMASTDAVVRALFQKAGVIYCSSRNDLISVGCVLQSQQLTGPRIAIITHAGGSAVMLTDMLSSRGLEVPHLPEDQVADLLKKLNPGSSVANPIDFLATGTAAQLGEIIDKCEQLPMIDAMVVVFGSPGLFNVRDVYQVIDDKMAHCKKPIYPVLPSLVNAKSEIELFLSKGHVNFPDEVELGVALTHVYQCPKPTFGLTYLAEMKDAEIRNIIYQSNNGYLSPAATRELLIAAGIDMVDEYYFNTEASLKARMAEIPRPAVMKVVGLVHKTEVKGITLNIYTYEQMLAEYQRIMAIPGARGVMLQPMVEGIELFCGAKREGNFGHLIICGLGGIFVEVLKDIATGLAPLSMDEALKMVRALKAYPIIEGYRNLPGASEKLFAEAVMRISSLVFLAPEIAELDINPLKGTGDRLTAVDARIRIEKGLN
jgi:acetyltransferase